MKLSHKETTTQLKRIGC